MKELPATTLYHMAWLIGKLGADTTSEQQQQALFKKFMGDDAPTREMLDWMIEFADRVGGTGAADLLRQLGMDLKERRMTELEFAQRLDGVTTVIKGELDRQSFLQVPTAKIERGVKWPPFGLEVTYHLKVDRDITDVLRCWMYGLPTACVFHLMRVVEGALQALVTLARVRNAITVRWPTWDQYLQPIESKLRPPQPKKQGVKPRRMNRRDEMFFGDAAAQIRNVSRAWRSPVVHEIAVSYTDGEATVILDHVEAFARHVAKRMEEKSPTSDQTAPEDGSTS